MSDQFYKPRPDVLFSGEANGMVFHLRKDGISYQLYKVAKWKTRENFKSRLIEKVPDKSIIFRVDVNWLGTTPDFRLKTDSRKNGCSNFYLPACPEGIHGVNSYGNVNFQNIYRGIDLIYYCKDGQLKYDYVVGPGADYKQIEFEIVGADRIFVNAKGCLEIMTPIGTITEQAPVVKQFGKILKAKWLLMNNRVKFIIYGIDTRAAFVIDPAVVVRAWGTYYGGSGNEQFNSCATDGNGNVFATGLIDNQNSPNIATVGSHQFTFAGGNSDALLVKINSAGVRQWATYYGAAGDDYAYSCATDTSGNVFVAGTTESPTSPAIATAGCHQPGFGGVRSAFLVKFNSSGQRQWGTYYGGYGSTEGISCATDVAGRIFLAGITNSQGNNVITTPGTHQPMIGGSLDAFLVQFNTNGQRQWGTYYGGAGQDDGYDCICDASGNVYLAGRTTSNSIANIATAGCHQPTFGGGLADCFLVKFTNGGVRQWGTYYGGSGWDDNGSVATDGVGNIFLSGETLSSNGTSIATPGSHQSSFGGGNFLDAFLVKFNSAGVRQWGTYCGDGSDDRGNAVCTDVGDNVYLTGFSYCNTGTIIARSATQSSPISLPAPP